MKRFGRIKIWANVLIIGISVTLALAFIYGYLTLIGFLATAALNTPEMLQSIIQAEATILGFIGIIGVYLLTSYDSRIDRFSQQIFDFSISRSGKESANDITSIKLLYEKLEKMKKLKKDALEGVAVTSAVLILALLLSVTTIGVRNQIIGGFGFYLFFGGIASIVYLFYQTSHDSSLMA